MDVQQFQETGRVPGLKISSSYNIPVLVLTGTQIKIAYTKIVLVPLLRN